MTPEVLAAKLRAVVEEYPPGIVLYHRASGQRMVVIGYALGKDDKLKLRCDPGNGGEMLMNPIAMTTEKPSTSTQDDE